MLDAITLTGSYFANLWLRWRLYTLEIQRSNVVLQTKIRHYLIITGPFKFGSFLIWEYIALNIATLVNFKLTE